MKTGSIILKETDSSILIIDLGGWYISIKEIFSNQIIQKLMIGFETYPDQIIIIKPNSISKIIKIDSFLRYDLKDKLDKWSQYIVDKRFDDTIELPTIINKEHIDKIFPLLLDEEITENHIKQFNELVNDLPYYRKKHK